MTLAPSLGCLYLSSGPDRSVFLTTVPAVLTCSTCKRGYANTAAYNRVNPGSVSFVFPLSV